MQNQGMFVRDHNQFQAMKESFEDDSVGIPEPTPIHPCGIQNVVPCLPLTLVRQWEELSDYPHRISSSSSNACCGNVEPVPDLSSWSYGSLTFQDSANNGVVHSSGNSVCLEQADEKHLDTNNIGTSASLQQSDHASPFFSSPKFMSIVKKMKEEENAHQNLQQGQWNVRFQELLDFHNENGHSNVIPATLQLTQWIKSQRYQYRLRKKGAHSTLTDERLHALQQIGFVFEAHQSSWLFHYQTLREFHAKYGHCNVPNAEKSLVAWCKHQRREYRKFIQGERTRITCERIDALESLGFNWDPRGLFRKTSRRNTDQKLSLEDV